MEDLEATRRSYDAVALDYARLIGDELLAKPFDRALLATFAELVGTAAPVADIGCGPGHVAAHLAGIGVEVVGLDLSPRMCALAASTTSSSFAAADMTRLPLGTDAVAGIVCLYAVIHLDEAARAATYREFARVLRPGGHLLLAFHTRDPQFAPGSANRPAQMMGHEVELTFRFLDPAAEAQALLDSGLEFLARLDRSPHPGVEHPSDRSYLIMQAR